MAQTTMRRFCHLQRLLARSPPDTTNLGKSQRNIGPAFEVDDLTYDHLFDYYHAQDDQWINFRKQEVPQQHHEPLEKLAMVQALSEVEDEVLNPVFKKLGITRVVEGLHRRIIPVNLIVSPLAHRRLPAWTMGLNSPSLLVMTLTSGEQHINPGNTQDMEEFYASQIAEENMAMDIDTDPTMI
ncbi:uncharacterized protein MELLADRAFT_68963 [Melampsora larici-populina 98AG31]|uniref:Uncharacterized protein n=1 Tax=Melampsora larici-populina (strain 98AG31 / pathotype 3-4-7) TaxID=747676 RepID=F4S8W7_MELLP|nr:uncharacterized protein MELLADRAFT_68963 [Melampsora larici-populina 98AG31]EGF98918.1 hypothetical protein MELLADRAFT_68963 [Melampsora larici-populina 98AG31]